MTRIQIEAIMKMIKDYGALQRNSLRENNFNETQQLIYEIRKELEKELKEQ